MQDGTPEDYALLAKFEDIHIAGLPGRIILALKQLTYSFGGYPVTRFEHSLQSATRAYSDGRNDEYIVGALLHDVGDLLAPATHGEMAAAIIRGYVSEEIYWIVKHHAIFQQYHFAHLVGNNRFARDRYKGHRFFDSCAEFCALYDENCFDPSYQSLPLEFFEPLIEAIFSKTRTPSWQ